MKRTALVLLVLVLLPASGGGQETKPTIYVPSEKCPAYTNLLREYFTSSSKRATLGDCRQLYAERERLLSAMMAYAQNSSCYSQGWKGSEVVNLLQSIIGRNRLEHWRCEAWLKSGRVCADGSVCPAGTTCTEKRLCQPDAKNPGRPDDGQSATSR